MQTCAFSRYLDGVLVRFEDDVKLEPLVLRAVDELLVLRLPGGDELRVLGPRGEAHPRVVEHLSAQLRAPGAFGVGLQQKHMFPNRFQVFPDCGLH